MSCPTTGTSCASIAQIIDIIPDLETYGGSSTGTITLAGGTTAGDTITIGGKTLTAVAGVASTNQWSVDGDEYTELQSIVDAINDSNNDTYGIVSAAVRTPGDLVITITSDRTGVYSNLPMSKSGANITLSGSRLSGGECDLEFFRQTACSMINSTCFGSKTLAASIYLVGHLIETADGNDNGVLTGRSIDKISESYAYVSPGDKSSSFANTKWGRLYLQLYKTIPKVPGVGTGLVPRSFYTYRRRRYY